MKEKNINNGIKNKGVFLVIFVAVIALNIFLNSADVLALVNTGENELEFSANVDLINLNIENSCGGLKPLAYGTLKTKEIIINISPKDCELLKFDKWDYLKVGNLTPYTKPGDPQLPMKTYIIKLPKNSEISDISVVSGDYMEILNKLDIIPTPEPREWTAKSSITNSNLNSTAIYSINKEIYNSNSYFPKKIIAYDVGDDNENTYLLVRFYPLQYMPQEKKAVLITNAKIEISYQTQDEQLSLSTSSMTSTAAVIITPVVLETQANALAAFHNDTGTSTTVVTTQYIMDNYDSAPDPDYEGYKDSYLPGRNNITNYNYTLAKKIVSYLKQNNNFKFVILFGNAKQVPPSYYIYDEKLTCGYCGWEECSIDYYNSWVPTDYFYASPDYDLIPNYEIGRIPVNNTGEAEHFVQKIKDWNSTVNWSWFKNAAVAGGRPFLDTLCGSGDYDELFAGEMSSTDIINKGYLSGMNITKFFRSDGKFNKKNMKEVLSGGYGMLYEDGHGYVDGWALEGELNGEYLTTSDVMGLIQNPKVPIVVSVVCLTGAFDTNLVDAGYDSSFAEAVLNSNAGGIAYITGSRTTYGAPTPYLKNGYVLQSMKERYMSEMASNIFKTYHRGGDSLGNLTKSAIFEYVTDNDFSDDSYNRRTLFEFVLLGDPALKIPVQQPGNYTKKPKLSVVNSQGNRDSYFAYGNMPTYSSGSSVTVTCQADSPTVKMKLIVVDEWFNETLNVQEVNVINGNATYTFTVNDTHLYLVRCIDNNSKEGWLYVNQPFATFTDSYSDKGQNLDYSWVDSKYDYLNITIGVNVKKAGEYVISGKLCDKFYCVSAYSMENLTTLGVQTVTLKFDGHKIYKLKMSGNYQLINLVMENHKGFLDYMPVDYRFNPYNITGYNWDDFEPGVQKAAYIPSNMFSTTYTDADYAINTDDTSYYNYLMVNVSVYVKEAGYYTVGGTLYGYYKDFEGLNDTYEITTASNYTYLDKGPQTVSLKFNGKFIYYFGNLYDEKFVVVVPKEYGVYASLSDSKGNSLDGAFLETNNKYNYNDFERLKDIFVSGYYSSSMIDIDNNGKYDYLTFKVRVNIPSTGYYGIGAGLYDSKYHEIDSAFTVENLTSGSHDIQLNFSGWKIHSNGYNGPYKILGLYIADKNSTLDFELNPHNTASYDYTSFESLPWKILLVDDDMGEDYEDDYKDALDANDYSYKYWDVYNKGNVSPGSTTLSNYDVVIWFTGEDYSTTLTSTDQSNLQTYLNSGGKLFISGQDIGYDLTNDGATTNNFYKNYLHAYYKGDNQDTDELRGVHGDFISDQLDINQFGSSPDVISPNGADKIFDYVGGSYSSYPAAGLKYDGDYRVVYLPFCFEFASKQYTLMDRIISWLLRPTTFKSYATYGEDTDGDTLYNYLVINVTLNVSDAGNYTIGGQLYDKNSKYVDYSETSKYLSAGMQVVQIKFDGYKIYNNGVSGNYGLRSLYIENSDAYADYPLDYAVDPYTTPSYLYTEFDRAFTGSYTESAEEIYETENAQYKYLTINVSVDITTPGQYTISGDLYDADELFITKASTLNYLESGIHVVELNFKGFDIYWNELDGEYYLKNLYIKDIVGTALDYKEIAYATSFYNYENFRLNCFDNDNDGYWGNTTQCSIGTDCDDNDSSINPGRPEIYCNNLDENCNGMADDCVCSDNDGDGYNGTTIECPIGMDCNDSDASIIPLTGNYINQSLTICTNSYNINGIIINSPNIILDCNNSVLNGTGTGYGIYNPGYLNVTIKNCKITNYEYGIYINNSNSNKILNNEILHNNIGIYSENSNSIINSNFVCGNTNLDFNSPDWLATSGNNNFCDKSGDWDDTGADSCWYTCGRLPRICDFNNDGILINDYNDLMTTYKCFLGIEINCNATDYQNWNLIKREYQCFVNTG